MLEKIREKRVKIGNIKNNKKEKKMLNFVILLYYEFHEIILKLFKLVKIHNL